ncbi:precorrin-2 dehydrogenase/sirohydrochlorin ferrochelatase family protein [Nafulsella turpanensis]|uniref:precorrin-2 dehydrogenase/sirohydrochlorin ferrochelatase family protein n=1 Tax=Nafulsella turpanensis TaxID=1265690 RepID=UPI0003492129|nr:bifunctional precorrin-2 dehydrogenase/sirohydrochlorin ferrochelatase [Nafulsella turpanensis]
MSQGISKESGNLLFPIFLKLDQLDILIVGGGNVGQEKLEALLKNNQEAKVRLIGTHIKREIFALAAAHPGVQLEERSFDYADLEGIEVLILATDSPQTNAEIQELAKEKGILTNVADTPHLCDFYLGSTVKKGNLKIGISTNGKSPTFAKRFRELLEESLPDDIDELLTNLHQLRNMLKGNFQYKVKKLNEYTASLLAGQGK